MMVDFDRMLHARLAALDAAVPVRSRPNLTDATPSRRFFRPRTIVLLVAAVLIVTASAVGAKRVLYPDIPEPKLEAALQQIWAGHDCLSAKQATDAVQQALDNLRYSDWRVTQAQFVGNASCVAAGVIAPLHEVRLWPGISADLERTKDAIVAGLLRTCMGRAEAIQYVTSMLTTAGSDPFVVHADPWGPQGGPIDKIDEYRAHVAAGCFVYVGMPTRDSEGRAVHDLWGPWP
jgi:hypothetical protein